MHWGAYEVFSFLSGVTLIGAALLPGAAVKERLGGVLAGIFFIGYAIFVAGQTSGTFTFPVWIFVIPFGGAAWAIKQLVSRGKSGEEPGVRSRAESSAAQGVAMQRPAGAAGVQCGSCAARLAKASAFCTTCGSPVPPPTRFCIHCGRDLEPGSAFCIACGTAAQPAG
jgi:hypothetical protein